MDNKLKIIFSITIGIFAGLAMAMLAELRFKWTIIFAMVLFFPVFVRMMGSLKYALLSVLIFSLSTQMSFNPFYSAHYTTTELGWRVSLTILVLAAIYLVGLFEILLRRNTVRFFWGISVPLLLLIFWGWFTADTAKKPTYVPFLLWQAVQGYLVFLAAANAVKNKSDVKFIIKWSAITVILTALVAITQYFKPDFLNLKFMGWVDEPLKLYYGRKVISRPSGFLGHANNLAAFLVCWLSLFFVVLIGTKEKVTKRFLPLLAFGLGLAALVLSFSRGGWLAFGLSLFLIFCLMLRRNIRQILPDIVPRMAALWIVGILLVAPFAPHIYNRLTGDDYSAGESRIMLAKNALDSIAKNPVNGLGFGYYLDFDPVPPHNMYLQTAAELGIPGLVLFLWASWGFFARGFFALRSRDPQVLLLTIGLLAGLAGEYLHGMVELGTVAYHKFLTYFFIGGLLTALGQFQRDEERAVREKNGPKPQIPNDKSQMNHEINK